jgi:hypothetical protein
MIEDVMYGVILSAKTDIAENEPPVIESKKFKALSLFSNKLANALPLMPGTGSKLPSLTTISIINVIILFNELFFILLIYIIL